MHSGAVHFALALVTVLGATALLARGDGDIEGTDVENKPNTGFSVQKEDQKVVDALDEFDRYVGKEAWEKAFGSLNTAADATPKGLIAIKQGFLIPTRLRIRKALSSLPPAGRAAYRLFNDAKAKADLDRVGDALTPEQLTTLRKIADQYFISSVGDQATDRLADALFEKGDFATAAGYWNAILRDFPDTTLAPVKLLTKRAVALARAGDRGGFNAVVAEVRERYAGQTVRIAGQDVVATDFLAGVSIGSPTTTTAPSTQPDNSLVDANTAPAQLPAADEPAWQFPLADEALHAQVMQQLVNMGWGNMAGNILGGGPAVAVDAQRLYGNWLGLCFAIDLKTGKLLWRTGKFSELTQQVQQMVQEGRDNSGAAVIVVGDRVLFVRKDPKRNDYNAPSQLVCIAADTGKTLWSSDNLSFFKEWSFCGNPMVVGQSLLALAHPQSGQDVSLMSIALKDGSQQWSTPLGTPTMTQNWRGMQITPQQTMVLDNGKLYVLTNNGALLCIDVGSHNLEWAFSYDTRTNPYENRFGFNPYQQQQQPDMPGAVLIAGGTLYFKETGGTTLYAIDTTGPSLKWKRPLDDAETLLTATDSGMLVLGQDLGLIDLSNNRELKWNAQLPMVSAGTRPLLGSDHLWVFLARGVFDYDLNTGDTRKIFRGYDHDSTGGSLWRTPGRVITVSNRAITAYAVP